MKKNDSPSLLKKKTRSKKNSTTRYDVAEHRRTPEEMAAYLEACIEETRGDAAFVAKALDDRARAKGMVKSLYFLSITPPGTLESLPP